MKAGIVGLLCVMALTGCKTLSTATNGLMDSIDLRAPHNKIEGTFIESEYARATQEPKIVEPATEIEEGEKKSNVGGLLDALAGGKKDNTLRGYQLGNAAAKVAAAGVVDLPEMETYMGRIVQRLLNQWPYGKPDELSYKIQVDSSLVHNAEVSRDGVISVSLGAIRDTESEDELAFILGHELSHLLLGHHQRGEYMELQGKIIAAGVNVANASVYANNLQVKSTDTADGKHFTMTLADENKVGKKVVSHAVTKMLLQELTTNLWSSSWSRTLEDEADLLGLDLMVKAGYNLGTSGHVMQRFASMKEKEKVQRKAMIDRQQAQLSEAFASQGINEGVNQAANMAMAGIISAGKGLWKQIGAGHRSPEQREQNLAEYGNREYRKLSMVQTNEADYQRQVGKTNVRELILAYSRLGEANRALSEENIDRAALFGEQVLRSRIGNSTKTRILMYQVRKYQDKHHLALKNLELISDWENAPVNAYDSIINEYLSRKRLSDAERYLEMAWKHYGKEPFYGLEIALRVRQEEIEQAQAVYDSCMETGNKTWKATCEITIGDFKPESKFPKLFGSVLAG